ISWPSEIRRPSGDYDSWGTWSVFPTDPATRWDKVLVQDGDAAYISASSWAWATFSFPAFTIPSNAVGIAVELHAFVRNNDTGTSGIYFRIESNGVVASTIPELLYRHSDYQEKVGIFVCNPFTEAPWTVDEINGVGANSLDAFGIYAHDVKPPVLVTQIYAKVYPLGLIIGDAAHAFTGQFDGKGHEISNLFIYRPPIEPTGQRSLVYLPRNAPDFIGLFPNVDDPAIIKNVGIVDCDITGRDVTGALIGSNTGEITSCHSSGSVTGGG
ncbi:unnamed protein product, partial [marine sediment metagenome]